MNYQNKIYKNQMIIIQYQYSARGDKTSDCALCCLPILLSSEGLYGISEHVTVVIATQEVTCSYHQIHKFQTNKLFFYPSSCWAVLANLNHGLFSKHHTMIAQYMIGSMTTFLFSSVSSPPSIMSPIELHILAVAKGALFEPLLTVDLLATLNRISGVTLTAILC